MDGFITQIVSTTATTSRKREEARKRSDKKKAMTEKKEPENKAESYGAIYIHGDSEMTPITYKKPKSR